VLHFDYHCRVVVLSVAILQVHHFVTLGFLVLRCAPIHHHLLLLLLLLHDHLVLLHLHLVVLQLLLLLLLCLNVINALHLLLHWHALHLLGRLFS